MHAYVVRLEWLTPAMVRIVLGGGDLEDFAMVDATDAYVNLAFPAVGDAYGGAFDPAAVTAVRPRAEWPLRRRYTVRRWDGSARQLTIDFVVHGDAGVAGRWARSAAPGDVLVFEGPAGGYRPDPTADWHLLVGDESALPAIAASLEVLPEGVPAVVRLLCDGPEHELTLIGPAGLDLRWSHRNSTGDPTPLLTAVRRLVLPPGKVDAFIHGEADEIRAVRRHLLTDRAVARSSMSCSPYWRRTMADEAWRRIKGEYVAAMEAEVA